MQSLLLNVYFPHDTMYVEWALRLQADVLTCSSKAVTRLEVLPETKAAHIQPEEAVGCAFLPKLALAEPPCRYTNIFVKYSSSMP